MRVMLCTSDRLVSRVIRWLTGSDWSHCAILSELGYAVEATWPRVRLTTEEELIRKHKNYVIIDLPCADPEAAYQAVLEQVGKPYDLTALVGWLSGRDWQEEDSWFCSELAAYGFAKGGSPLFREGVLHRVTPQHLWMVRP